MRNTMVDGGTAWKISAIELRIDVTARWMCATVSAACHLRAAENMVAAVEVEEKDAGSP